jgi:hypothetical protein
MSAGTLANGQKIPSIRNLTNLPKRYEPEKLIRKLKPHNQPCGVAAQAGRSVGFLLINVTTLK